MKIFQTAFFAFIILCPVAVQAASVLPTYELEKKIAYQQGQFGGLYARCGSPEDQEIIGGSLASWRSETFRGYHGSPDERAGLEKVFDDAANTVVADSAGCQDWLKQAAATWHSIVYLSQYGMPVASNTPY